VRGTNRFLPADIAVQWCQPVAADFHARNSARGPALPLPAAGVAGAARRWSRACAAGSSGRWTPTPCAQAAAHLIGEHDFTSFRAAGCQALAR
jgi:tRNA pseudouridine38-40 synthase